MNLGEVFLLGFVELHGLEADVAVALAVNNALLQGSEGLGPGYRGGAAAKSLVGGDQHRALRHAELQVLHVRHLFDGMLGIGNEAKVGIGPAENSEAGLEGEALQQIRGLAVCARYDFVKVIPKIGEIKNAETLFKRHQVRNAAHCERQSAFLHIAEGFGFVAQLAAIKQFNLDRPLGRVFNIFFERARGHSLFGIFGIAHGNLEVFGRKCLRAQKKNERQCQG